MNSKLAAFALVLSGLAVAGGDAALAGGGDDSGAYERARAATLRAVEREASQPERGNAPHVDLRSERAGRSPVRAARDASVSERAAERTTRGPDAVPAVLRGAGAVTSQRGCRTRFVRNRSSRGGARPALLVMHFTVSPNRFGPGDVDGITNFFNRARSRASSNYVSDAEGNCNYIVSEGAKAWTQGAFNPWSISWEVINTGRELTYAGAGNGPGMRKLGLTVSDAARRWGIPLRYGATKGCRIVRSGIVDHESLGCGNNHTDIKPYRVGPVINAAKSARRGAGATPQPQPLDPNAPLDPGSR